MRSKLFRIPKTGTESVLVQVDRVDQFYDARHYHPEIQITLIQKGSGTRFIGDSIERFSEGDIYMIGPNLPHVFRNEGKSADSEHSYAAASVSVYFNKDLLGGHFSGIPETRAISELIERSHRGIHVLTVDNSSLAGMIGEFPGLEGFDRILGLLTLLNILAGSIGRSVAISSMSFASPPKDSDNRRINAVFEYIIRNYDSEIRLENVSEIANMAPTAFCRYFKSRTRNTFTEFLQKIRVGQACRLLIEEDLSVSQVCYRSGFNNLSNFNSVFKSITGYTPTAYAEMHRVAI